MVDMMQSARGCQPDGLDIERHLLGPATDDQLVRTSSIGRAAASAAVCSCEKTK
jgi:hypothetical protein